MMKQQWGCLVQHHSKLDLLYVLITRRRIVLFGCIGLIGIEFKISLAIFA